MLVQILADLPVLKEPGIQRRPPYNCRHTYATIRLMSGLNPAFIAQQLGHSMQMLLSAYACWLNSSSDWSELATPVAVLRLGDSSLRADLVRWGWRPHWAADRAAPINARVEKVAHGAFFRAIWPHRAVTPIDGWYESVDVGGPKKQPYYIRRQGGQPSLCSSIGQFIGSEHDGFVTITADAQGGMIDVHDRRSVVLSPSLARHWMDSALPKSRPSNSSLILVKDQTLSSGTKFALVSATSATKAPN